MGEEKKEGRKLTARFITEDPIKDGLNWYVYCSNNPINFIDPTGLGIWDIKFIQNFLKNKVNEYQAIVDKFEELAKNKEDITIKQKKEIVGVYRNIIIGGFLSGNKEAGGLLNNYLNPSSGNPFFGPLDLGGDTPDAPRRITISGVYKKSPIVKYAMDEMKKIISEDPNNNLEINTAILEPTNWPYNDGGVNKDGSLRVQQEGDSLFHVDHQFYLNSNTEVLDDGSLKTMWSVLSFYDFESYDGGLGESYITNIPIPGTDEVLLIEDGLSNYLTEWDIAESFWYIVLWEETWKAENICE